jgi:hypothetical protein
MSQRIERKSVITMEIKTNNNKYHFYIENNFLIIKKRTLFREKDIKKNRMLKNRKES